MTTYIPPAMSHEWDGASDWENSTASSESSFDDEDDEDDVNVRVYPDWCLYRNVIESRGFRLDTRRDVKVIRALVPTCSVIHSITSNIMNRSLVLTCARMRQVTLAPVVSQMMIPCVETRA